jgi:predicted esterase
VQAALAKTKERHPGRVLDDSLVLVGFSNGGYAVASLLRAHALPVRGIVIHGAEASFEAKDLKDVRIVFTAGELDGAASFMKAQAKRLASQGIEARWVSLGQQGHFISVDSGKEVAEMIDWARAR